MAIDFVAKYVKLVQAGLDIMQVPLKYRSAVREVIENESAE